VLDVGDRLIGNFSFSGYFSAVSSFMFLLFTLTFPLGLRKHKHKHQFNKPLFFLQCKPNQLVTKNIFSIYLKFVVGIEYDKK